MDRYVGLDAHAETCTLAVMGPTGKRLTSRVVETNGRALLEGPLRTAQVVAIVATAPVSDEPTVLEPLRAIGGDALIVGLGAK